MTGGAAPEKSAGAPFSRGGIREHPLGALEMLAVERIVAQPLVVALARDAGEARRAPDAERLHVADEKGALAMIDHLAEKIAELGRRVFARRADFSRRQRFGRRKRCR